MRALSGIGRQAAQFARRFLREKDGNVAMMFGLSAIVILSAAGGALDWSRAMVTKTRLGTALDAAGLAVGTTNGLTDAQLQAKAQQYFDANYPSSTIGTPGAVHVTVNGQAISLSVDATVPTTLLKVVNIDSLNLSVSNQIVRAVTKLRVALVLDNTGSMAEQDGTGTSKISALKTATHQLLTQLQNAAINPGDVQVALIPFSLDVNVGTSAVGASWIDWTDWEDKPATPATSIGPGDNCPWSTTSQGYKCTNGPTNEYNCVIGNNNNCASSGDIPSSGTYKGYICPSARKSDSSNGRGGHFWNGCFTSVPQNTDVTTDIDTTPVTEKTQSCSQRGSGTITCTDNSGSWPQNGTTNNGTPTTATQSGWTGDSGPTTTTTNSSTVTTDGTKTCTGSGSNRRCTWTRTLSHTKTDTTVTKVGVGPWTHNWVYNSHSTWNGCVMDRNQNYDVQNTAPAGTATNFPAENSAYCPPAQVKALGFNWSDLNTAVDSMTPNGSTNQTIGFSWGWQALTEGVPLNAPTADSLTSQVIIILSDGLNTQNRWAGDGSNQNNSVDAREGLACTNAKAAGVLVYTLFVDLGGTSGNSAPLQNCASDAGKYFDLTTSGQIVSAFNQIGTELANLHLAQ